MGGVGGEECGLPTGAGALDGRVSGRERGGGVRGGAEEGTELGRGKARMGFFQEAYDADCAAIACALAVAAERSKRHKLGRVRIFTDNHADDARRAWPGPDLRPSGEEGR